MNTLAFLRFDLMSWLPSKQTLLPLALIVVVGIALPVPGMAIVASAVVTSMMISAPFLADERGRLDTLYGVLPLSRRSIVVGRTIAILTYYVLASAVAVVTTWAVAIARGSTIPFEIAGISLAVGFAFIGLAMSLQLPVLFRIGYSRGRLIAYAPALVIAGVLWVNQTLGLIEFDGEFAAPVSLVLAAGFGIGALGFAVGAIIALRMYRTRELR